MSAAGVTALWQRLRVLVGRGRITGVDDARAAQVLQVKLGADETKDGTPRAAEYGFVSMPPLGTDAIVIFIGGERTNGVVIATNNQTFRMRNLANGEVAIHDDKGRFVLLGAAGIHVQGNDSPITAETTSDVTVTAGGDLTAQAGGRVNVASDVSIKLAAPTIIVQASQLLELLAPNIAVAGEAVGVQGAMSITGETDIIGATSITGDTAIAGALTNNGHDVGPNHEHLPGTFKAGSTSITGVSGHVTP